MRKWLAERFSPEAFGATSKTQVSVSWGQLHLDALRQRAAEGARVEAAATLVVTEGNHDARTAAKHALLPSGEEEGCDQ